MQSWSNGFRSVQSASPTERENIVVNVSVGHDHGRLRFDARAEALGALLVQPNNAVSLSQRYLLQKSACLRRGLNINVRRRASVDQIRIQLPHTMKGTGAR